MAPDDQARNLIVRPAVFVHLDDSLRRLSETLAEEPSDGAAILAMFERENERLNGDSEQRR